MRVDARFVHSDVPFDSPFSSHLVVSLTGSTPKDGEDSSKRPRLGIIPVLDRTGSMSWDRKLPTAVAALSHVCGFLSPTDALGLVSFAASATSHLAPAPNQRDRYMSALSEISANGGTNLAAGLNLGVSKARELAAEWAGQRFEIRVVLVSDGLANIGVTSPDRIAAIAADLPAGVRVTTIGVGRDCDHDLLAQIAAVGGGSYGFAEGSDAIPRLLGAEFGAALSIDASDVEVEIRGREMVSLAAPLAVSSTPLGAPDAPDGFRVSLPTLLAGETRHFVLPVVTTPPGRRHARRVTAAEVVVSDAQGRIEADADTSSNGASAEVSGFAKKLLPKLFFSGKPCSAPPTLQEAVDRALAAEALAKAESLASSGNFVGAAMVLNQVSSELRTPGLAASVSSASDLYSSGVEYAARAAERASYNSAFSPTARLLGSSDAFDASWSRTMGGSYQSESMREAASQTASAVSGPDKVTPTPPSSFSNWAHRPVSSKGALSGGAPSGEWVSSDGTGLDSVTCSVPGPGNPDLSDTASGSVSITDGNVLTGDVIPDEGIPDEVIPDEVIPDVLVAADFVDEDFVAEISDGGEEE